MKRERKRAKRLRTGLPILAKELYSGPCTFCGNPKHYAKKLCRNCWYRCYRNGSPCYQQKTTESIAQKFQRSYQTDEATGCWVWQGSCSGNGIPDLAIGYTRISARRFAYEQIHGAQIANAHFKSGCGNRRCVNPQHALIMRLPQIDESARVAVLSNIGPLTTTNERRIAAGHMRTVGMSLRDIGHVLGVTGERARQYLLPPPPRPKQCRWLRSGTRSLLCWARGSHCARSANAWGYRDQP